MKYSYPYIEEVPKFKYNTIQSVTITIANFEKFIAIDLITWCYIQPITTTCCKQA